MARKGATLSDKTARAEFGLSRDEIFAAIRAGKLQDRPAADTREPVAAYAPQDRDRPGWLPRLTARPHQFPPTYFPERRWCQLRDPVRRSLVTSGSLIASTEIGTVPLPAPWPERARLASDRIMATGVPTVTGCQGRLPGPGGSSGRCPAR